MGPLTEIRSLLSAQTRDMGGKGGATSKEIVSAFRKKYPDQVGRVATNLIDIALIKLVSDVSNRKPRGVVAGQGDLFGEYKAPSIIAIRVDGNDGPQHVRKTLMKTTIGEAKQYLRDHGKPSATPAERKELKRLVRELEPYKKSDASTIEECWQGSVRARKSGS